MLTAAELGLSEQDLAEQVALSESVIDEVVEEEEEEEEERFDRLVAQPPKSPADLDRFWSDVEQACADRDEFTQDIIFDSFYL